MASTPSINVKVNIKTKQLCILTLKIDQNVNEINIRVLKNKNHHIKQKTRRKFKNAADLFGLKNIFSLIIKFLNTKKKIFKYFLFLFINAISV